MDYRTLALGLGLFSVGLGLAELVAPGRLRRWLGLDCNTAKRVLALFGARVNGLPAECYFAGRGIDASLGRLVGDGLDRDARLVDDLRS